MIKNADSCPIGNVYISGPITGIENWQDSFLAAEKELLELSRAFFVVNPVSIAKEVEELFAKFEKTPDYTDYMRKDIKELSSCSAICMLPGWKRSKGARLEYRIAKILNMQVLEWQPN